MIISCELFGVKPTRRKTLFIFWRVGVACWGVCAYSVVMSICSVIASPVGVPVCARVAPVEVGSVMSVYYRMSNSVVRSVDYLCPVCAYKFVECWGGGWDKARASMTVTAVGVGYVLSPVSDSVERVCDMCLEVI